VYLRTIIIKKCAVTSLLLATAAYFLPLRPWVLGFMVAQRPPHAFGSVRLCRTFLLHLPWHAGGSVRGTADGGGLFLLCCGPWAQRPPHAFGNVRLTAAMQAASSQHRRLLISPTHHLSMQSSNVRNTSQMLLGCGGSCSRWPLWPGVGDGAGTAAEQGLSFSSLEGIGLGYSWRRSPQLTTRPVPVGMAPCSTRFACIAVWAKRILTPQLAAHHRLPVGSYRHGR
jgi:hypothetical protein